MLQEIKYLIKNDRKLQIILFIGLLVQIIFSVTNNGFHHPDQHFQIIEFSSYQLGKPTGAGHVWEMTNFVRPTLQVYLFSAYSIICELVTINDPYTQLTILRIFLGIVMFAAFNVIAIYYFKNSQAVILYAVLCILNFSWCLPYTRTLFSSEILSSLFFFGALFLYDCKKYKSSSILFLLGIGFLFSISFYLRFQMASALLGFGIWILFFEKKYQNILPLIVGFTLGIAINVYLDYLFYNELIFTPYSYFHANINAGRAAEFGTSSFLFYVGVFLLTITIPPFSFILFYYGIKAIFKKYDHILVLPVVFFIAAHLMIGHKEDRFLFPILNVLPIIIGFVLTDLIGYIKTGKKWITYSIKIILFISIFLNTALLVLLTITPYSQTVHFSYKLKIQFKMEEVAVYCLPRTPWETESGGPMVFYQKGIGNIKLKKIFNKDSIRYLGNAHFIAATFNDLKVEKPLLDSLGYKPIIYSSKLLWRINEFLTIKKINSLNDIWILYKKD